MCGYYDTLHFTAYWLNKRYLGISLMLRMSLWWGQCSKGGSRHLS